MSICLTTKTCRAKLKPVIVFQGAKHEATTLNEEFKNRCVLASSSNGWMKEELVLKCLRQVLWVFSFKKRLFAWDTFYTNKTKDVRKLLNRWKLMMLWFLGIHQVCSSTWCGLQQTFRTPHNRILWWIVSIGVHQYTEVENMKPVIW